MVTTSPAHLDSASQLGTPAYRRWTSLRRALVLGDRVRFAPRDMPAPWSADV